MVLPFLLLHLIQTAAPTSTVVVVTRRTAVSTEVARGAAVLVTDSLKKAGVEVAWEVDGAAKRLAALGVKDTSSCQGRRACVQEFGRQLDVAVLVGVSVSELDSDRSVVLEATRVSDGVILARESLLYARTSALPTEQLKQFATRTRTALGAAPLPTDAPTQPVLPAPTPPPVGVLQPAPEPAPAAPAVVRVQAPAPQRSHAGALVLGAGAVLAAAAAVTLGVLAMGARAELTRGTALDDGRTGSPLTGRQALARSGVANGELYGAAAAGAVALALGTTAVVVW